MTGAPQDTVRPVRGNGTDVFGVFLIFAVLGPPLAAVFATGMLPFIGRHGAAMPARLDDFINGFVQLTLMAYLFGGLQAIAMGLVAAIWHFLSARPWISLLMVMSVSLAIGLVVVVVLAKPFSMPAPHAGIVTAVLILHVGPAVLCGLIANRFLRNRERKRASVVVS
jgi:FlaA1/EpsC-like NDP-sugar epimerase